jgi:hypothetical protein
MTSFFTTSHMAWVNLFSNWHFIKKEKFNEEDKWTLPAMFKVDR